MGTLSRAEWVNQAAQITYLHLKRLISKGDIMFCMEQNLIYTVFEEDGAFVARCLDVEVASEGDTQEGAIDNLKEALELYFEDHAVSIERHL